MRRSVLLAVRVYLFSNNHYGSVLCQFVRKMQRTDGRPIVCIMKSWNLHTTTHYPNSFCQAAHYIKFVYLLLILNASTALSATLVSLET